MVAVRWRVAAEEGTTVEVSAASSLGSQWRDTRAVWASLASVLLSWFLLPAATSRAQTTQADIELEAALPRDLERCVTTQSLRASYATTLAAYGGEGSQAPALRLRVREQAGAHAQRGADMLEVSAFSAERELGVRTLPVKASDCDALPNTLALLLVLLAHTAPDQAAQARPPLPAAPVPAPAAPQSAADPQPTAARAHANIELSAGAQALFGVLPHNALGLQLRAASAWKLVALRLAVGLLWPQDLRVAEGSIHWRGYELALEACSYQLQAVSWLALRLCGGPRAGVMFARSQDFALQTRGTGKVLFYLGVLPEAAIRLGPATSLQLGAGIALALLRPQFFVALDGGERVQVFKEPSLLRAELALSLAQIF